MTTYISLLRGINVSGKNTVKMDVLKQLATKLNFVQAQTYIQSGNLLFRSEETDTSKLSLQLQQAIHTELGLLVPVLTLAVSTFQNLIDQCPITLEEEQAQLYVTFFGSFPKRQDSSDIFEKLSPKERLILCDSVAYLVAAIGYGNTKITNAFLEKKLQITATTRNYKTCKKLVELARNL